MRCPRWRWRAWAVDAAPVGDDLAARFVARVDARSRAGTGDTIEFYLDTKELHFFDPETHLAIDDAEVVSREWVLLSRSKDAE